MRYHNITNNDMKNGDGLRVVLWLAGCPHHCLGCHNPVTHDPNGGLLFQTKDMIELIDDLEKPWISGLTLSGGDPLAPYNAEGVLDLINQVRTLCPTKTIWVYTGYVFEDLLRMNPIYTSILKSIDILVDGKFIADKKDTSLEYRGSSNQRVINMKSYFKRSKDYIIYDRRDKDS